ncbi:MAG: DNA repair protein RecO [Gammaproteobacteria bacterium]|nr:DNA repair protein RecO [Gammaproteobacteria bacterium]
MILQLLTIDHGLTSVIARGARKAKSPLKGLLQPFTPLQVSWYGRNELKTLRQADNDGRPYLLSAMPLWCGLYVNELLVKLLRRHDSSPTIFTLYQQTLAQLLQQSLLDIFYGLIIVFK